MSDALTLSRSEVVELTGYKRPGEQVEWLRRNGIPHFIAGDGRPRVVRAVLLSATEAAKPAPRLRLPGA